MAIDNELDEVKYILKSSNLCDEKNIDEFLDALKNRKVTELKAYIKGLENLIYNDYLTGINNRRSLYKYINNLNVSKGEFSNIALFILDLDNFKNFNDTFGHFVGDKVLISVAKAIVDTCKDAFVARIAGDEFIVIYKDITDEEAVMKIGENILKAINNIYIKDADFNKISASLGAVIGCKDGDSIEDLLVKGDIALYKAKSIGKNKSVLYTIKLDKERKFTLEIEKDIVKAIKNDEIEVHYQPKYTCKKKLVGFEALFRWNNPKYKKIQVLKIINIIEQSNSFEIFNDYIMKEAFKFSKKINKKNTKNPIKVSINISSKQIMSPNFIFKFKELLREEEVDPKFIEIEITETVLLENIDENISKIKILKDMGVSIYLDDFGTGYSSLKYLISLPVSGVKIDRGFVAKMNKGEEYIKLLNSIVKICCTLKLPVVAEGVETEKELNILKKMDIKYIQGYLFSKPLPKDEALKLLRK
ncbi:putative bifunctional diguanylate cyclase/phosphodiesterase [Eubacterium multiforme]|uniref:Diguanylate cyclase (GGDEF)-like protein n=1 Tax=Eubacterium multiforme TaxID=83339 RepID=A0ABT9UVK4_9FIRM|nr:bifunctional diguanylate cyclase/phosphodiesterase [Eubacterium multiforme]MDQ0150314.1 diguanylate cyclase (GGDEF)-like protein [Eubacterium multiforme]